jgi:hypothetical protein
MASLVRGEHEKFVEEFYWYLLHSTATHAFPEGILLGRRTAWSDTIPHATGAANCAFLLRHALVHEQGDELHLLLGAPDWWLENGREIRIERAPTLFGTMNLRLRGTAVLLRQRCVSGRAAAATVRGRQPKRIKLCPEPNSPLPTSISYDIS